MSAHRVLVPFELPDADPMSGPLVETLATMEVVALGHYGLPEQTPPSVARDQFEADAGAELDELVRPFEAAGARVSTRLVFGKARAKTVDRVAVEEDCDVVLTPGRAETVEGVFVPLRGAENADRILSFVAELLAATDASVTLFHADEADEQSDRESGEQLLADATDRLVAAGVDPDRIDRRRSTGEPGASIVEAGEAFDVLVLGETEPSLRDRILGALPARVTADTEDPTFVVRDVGES